VRMDLGTQVETLRLELPGDRRMLSRVPVPPQAAALLRDLRARLPRGESRDEILAAIAPSPGDTMGSWFSRILLRLLGPLGLVVVEPQTLRPFARGVVVHEIARPGEIAASIRRAEDAALARREPRALDLARTELFFLLDEAGRRLRVGRRDGAQGDDVWSAEDGRSFTSSHLAAMPPESFSWNVATRVLAQDVALPVAAQVCGPSEIRYCARLAEAHALVDAPAPWLVPRTTWEFVTPRARRLCRDLGIQWVDVRSRRTSGPPPVRGDEEPEVLRDLRQAVDRLGSGGSATVQRRRAALAHGVEAYSQALRRDAQERDAVRHARWARLLALAAPEGEDQDRRMSPLPWLAVVGTGALYEQVRGQRADAAMLEPGDCEPGTVEVVVPPYAEEGEG